MQHPPQHPSQGRNGPSHPFPWPSLPWLSHLLDVCSAIPCSVCLLSPVPWVGPSLWDIRHFPQSMGWELQPCVSSCSALKHPHNLRIWHQSRSSHSRDVQGSHLKGVAEVGRGRVFAKSHLSKTVNIKHKKKPQPFCSLQFNEQARALCSPVSHFTFSTRSCISPCTYLIFSFSFKTGTPAQLAFC